MAPQDARLGESSTPSERPALQLARPFAQPRSAPPVDTEPQAKRPTAPVFRPTPGRPVTDAPLPPPGMLGGAGESGQTETGQRPEATATLEPEVDVPANPFLSRDPRERARRLAHALVSDIIVYQPDKRRQALREGTLKETFRDEIRRSWREYKQQMGEEFATSTPYFTEALNEILAEGQQIF